MDKRETIMIDLEKLRKVMAEYRKHVRNKSLREIGEAAIKAEMAKIAEPLKRNY